MTAHPAGAELTYREGAARDLRATFTLSQIGSHHTARLLGVIDTPPPGEEEIEREWRRYGDLLEFVAAQEGGGYWICEDEGEPVGFGRVCRFGEMEQLTELMVRPSHHRQGIGRALLQRLWPDPPTPELGRLVIAAGAPADLTLYQEFGVMPSVGHWHLRAPAEAYVEARSQEIDATEPDIHVLSHQRAVEEWKRLEPPAIGHRRPALHDHFARTRTCLADMEASREGGARALCWVGAGGDIGPAVAAAPPDLVPVVLAALDRVAKAQEPDELGIFCTTDAWWLLRRLHGLGFRVHWPSWVMSSIPLPGLDRYLPTRPPQLI